MEPTNNAMVRRVRESLGRAIEKGALELRDVRRLEESAAARIKSLGNRTKITALTAIAAVVVGAGVVEFSPIGRDFPIGAGQSISTRMFGPWDEQLVVSFKNNMNYMAFEVTAVPSDATAFLVNGISNKGYWYQVGLSYNWPCAGGSDTGLITCTPGYFMNFEAFNSAGNSIFPPIGGGALPFNGPINSGDQVELALLFQKGNVIMGAFDMNTGAYAIAGYSAFGASKFVGTQTAMNNNGFSTGLMTERYCAYPDCGPEMTQVYKPMAPGNYQGTLFYEERRPSATKALDHKFVVARGCTSNAVEPKFSYVYANVVGNSEKTIEVLLNDGTFITGAVSTGSGASFTLISSSEVANTCRPK